MKSLQQLQTMAIKHWKEWLPEKTAKLQRRDRLHPEAHLAAVRAQKQMRLLMNNGYQEHEAEEVVLREYILLEPEQELDEELEEMERQYQAEEAEVEKALAEYDRKNPDPE